MPPLTHRLVGRPDLPDPTANYARLCIPYVSAVTLIDGTCDPAAFSAARLRDPAVHELAARVTVHLDENPDVNALWPQEFEIVLRDGRRWRRRIATPIGHPDNPLTRERYLSKFRHCWSIAGLEPARIDRVVSLVESLETCPDVARIPPLLVRD